MESSAKLSQELALELDAARVYGILLFAYKRKKLVSYVDLAKSLGMFSGGSQLASALGRVMEMTCDREDYPLLPAIVTKVLDGQAIMGPGEGFYEKARSLGHNLGKPEEHYDRWEQIIEKMGYDLNTLSVFRDDSQDEDPSVVGFVKRLAEDGLRFDLNPTMEVASIADVQTFWHNYVRRIDESVRQDATRVLSRIQKKEGI